MGAEACQGRSHALPEYLGGRMAGAEGQGRGDGSGRARMPKRVAGTAGSNATGWPRLWALFRQGRQQPGPTVRDLACRERKLGMTGMSNSSRMGTPASTAVPRTRVRCIRPGRAGLPGAPDRHAPGAYEGRRRQGRHRHMTLCLLLPFCLLQGQLARKKTAWSDPVPGGGDAGVRAGSVVPLTAERRRLAKQPPQLPVAAPVRQGIESSASAHVQTGMAETARGGCTLALGRVAVQVGDSVRPLGPRRGRRPAA